MLGQYRGEVVTEVRGVVEVLDVGAVDTEDVIDTTRRQIPDDVIDNTSNTSEPLRYTTIKIGRERFWKSGDERSAGA